MGLYGGNLCLDTRCTYYKQTEFSRRSLGYWLKKDGDACHVTKVGAECVAAHVEETPALRRLTGYAKLRQRKAVDFPLLTGPWRSASTRTIGSRLCGGSSGRRAMVPVQVGVRFEA